MLSSRYFSIIVALVLAALTVTEAFVHTQSANRAMLSASRSAPKTELNVFGKKKEVEDLSYIESRDMTREEMLELNKKNEDIMNMELQAMTGFSLVLSLPILYLCWVAFFSD